MKSKIAQGAEAIIYKDNSSIIKDRIKKNYRIDELDNRLRSSRTKTESKLIARTRRAGLWAPRVLERKKTSLVMKYIDGAKLRDYLVKTSDYKIMRKLGKEVLKMHEANIVHGDLTTSNLIKKGEKIYFIDFGLSEFSEKVEEKAVDLHVLKECLKSKHFDIWNEAWNEFLKSYNDKKVLERLKKVEGRGRYK